MNDVHRGAAPVCGRGTYAPLDGSYDLGPLHKSLVTSVPSLPGSPFIILLNIQN